MKKIIVLLSFLLAFARSQAAIRIDVTDPAYDDYEGLPLVEALLKDKKFDMAFGVLKSLPENDRSSARSFLLRGHISFQKANYKEAEKSYLQSIVLSAGKTKDVSILNLRLAETQVQLQNFASCAAYFDKTQESLNQLQLISKVQCNYLSDRWSEALHVLNQQPEGSAFIALEKVKLFLEMGLFQQAEEIAFQAFDLDEFSSMHVLQLAESFQHKNLSLVSLRILEAGRLVFSTELDIQLAWIQLAHQKNLRLFTAEAFVKAAYLDSKYFFHASESYRMLGMMQKSHFYGQMVMDPSLKLKGQLARAIDRGNYAQISSLEGPLMRSSLYKDDEVKYALAYALSRQGSNEKSLKILKTITKISLLEKSEALRKTF